jgi:predicted metal-dependent hydrolase
MKYIKSYEAQKKLQVGDYVKFNTPLEDEDERLNDFLNDNIGLIIQYIDRLEIYKVQFDNIDNLSEYFKHKFLNGSNYRFFSKKGLLPLTKKELNQMELKIQTNKFNL